MSEHEPVQNNDAAMDSSPESNAVSSNAVLENLAAHANLDFLLDVPLQVTVELGRSKITISE